MTPARQFGAQETRPSQSAFVRGFIDDFEESLTVEKKTFVSIRVRARLHR